MKITKLKGVIDYYGEYANYFKIVEKACKKVVEAYNYKEIITPVIEPAEVFLRTVGDESDIVGKEMYLFKDRGDRQIALKPETTASVMRMYVENKLYTEPGLKKYYYLSPNFRYDRPQAGRYRQFYQFGIEALGVESPYLDAEVIQMAYQIFNELGLKNIKININTLGSDETRKNYTKALKEYFSDKLDSLCDDCKRRFNTNPLRMLDCKKDQDTDILKNVVKIQDYLSKEDDEYFAKLLKTLDELNVPYVVNAKIVRGLDYYTNDIFEFIYENENSPLNNLAIGGGGRYNNLAKEFDGPDTPSIGFGMGMERLIGVLMELDGKTFKKEPLVVVISLSEEAKPKAIKIANELREIGYVVDLDYLNNNLKPQFKLCDRLNPDFIVIIGEDEIKNNTLKIKNTKTQDQFDLKVEELKEYFKK